MNNKKKIILPIILILLLIIVTVGVTYAFFNYTRTGSANTVRTGRIYFNHTQDDKIELSNVFPVNKNNLDSTNSDTVTINITGDTTYSEGIEYKVTLEEVNNTINNKEVPISIKATATNLGTEDSNYYTNRENKEKIYLLNEEGEAYNGKYIAVGYIPAGSTGVNGSIDITAFIDTNKVAITDTYLNDTDEDWVMGREVFTTSEWNSFNSSNPLLFKVKVEANEGIWVEQEKFLTMKNLYSDSNWSAIRGNITSVEFHKDGVAPVNYITSFDVTDTTSDSNKGSITLYTVDDGLGNNTYKAIVVANDTIYAPVSSASLFRSMANLVTINSENFKVDNVNSFSNMFRDDTNLINIESLSIWNTSKVTRMNQMFNGCKNLININVLTNWNTLYVYNMNQMFKSCEKITNISSLANWNVSNVTDMTGMFSNCNNLTNISGLSNWNTLNVQKMSIMFQSTNLSDIDDLSNWNVSNVNDFSAMFNGCLNLTNTSGINVWDISASASFNLMFNEVSIHPEFTKFPNGTWNENGTFTPNA